MATQTDYDAAFTTTRIGDLSFTAIDNRGPTTLTAGRYWHRKVTTADTGSQGALATAINTSIGVTTNGVQCAFNAANLTYTFTSSPAANFTLNLGSVLAAAMGFASGALAAASSYTSTKRPLYTVRPLIAGQSSFTDDYNPSGVMRARMADDGRSQYAISPSGIAVYRDWVQQYEMDNPLSGGGGGTYIGGSGHALMTRNVTATMPWSWQAFWDHVRCEEFFAWVSQTAPPSSATADVYKMRQETGEFHPQRATADYGLWHLRFNALLVGTQ